jgi:hypothetical protein
MATLTIGDVEYETDNFTEEQTKMLQEITFNNNIQSQLNYQSNSLQIASELLVGKLKKSLETPAESE